MYPGRDAGPYGTFLLGGAFVSSLVTRWTSVSSTPMAFGPSRTVCIRRTVVPGMYGSSSSRWSRSRKELHASDAEQAISAAPIVQAAPAE